MTTTEALKEAELRDAPSIPEIIEAITERVPIMLEITEEDRQKAGHFCDGQHCLVATALRRMGYKTFWVSSYGVCIKNCYDRYHADGIQLNDLHYNPNATPKYGPEVVGKQIVLYPTE